MGWRKDKSSLIGGGKQQLGEGVFLSMARKIWCIKIVITTSLLRMKKLAFATSHEGTGLCVNFSFALFKAEFTLFIIRHTTVNKQCSTANKIFKATALTYFSFTEGIKKTP